MDVSALAKVARCGAEGTRADVHYGDYAGMGRFDTVLMLGNNFGLFGNLWRGGCSSGFIG